MRCGGVGRKLRFALLAVTFIVPVALLTAAPASAGAVSSLPAQTASTHRLPGIPPTSNATPNGTTAAFFAAPLSLIGPFVPGLYVDPSGPCSTCSFERFLPRTNRTMDDTDTLGAGPDASAVAVRPDGRVIAVASTGPHFTTNPFVPGTQIAGRIIFYAPNGTLLAIVNTTADNLSWAPDGSFLLATVGKTAYRIDPSGTVTQIFSGGAYVRAFATPGGVIYVSQFNSTDPANVTGQTWQITNTPALFQNFAILPSVVSPDGTRFLRPAPGGGIEIERFDTGATQVIDTHAGDRAISWGPQAILIQFTDASGITRWGVGPWSVSAPTLVFEPSLGGFPGMADIVAWSPSGDQAIVQVYDPSNATSPWSIVVYKVADGSTYTIDPKGRPFNDIRWNAVNGMPSATSGGEFQPSARAPVAGSGRIAFIVASSSPTCASASSNALSPGIYTAKMDGSDVRPAFVDDLPFGDMGPGPEPGDVAFLVGNSIFSVPFDGSAAPTLIVDGTVFGNDSLLAYAFSPDGTHLITVEEGFSPPDVRVTMFVRNGTAWAPAYDLFTGSGLFGSSPDVLFLSDDVVLCETPTYAWIVNLATGERFPIAEEPVSGSQIPMPSGSVDYHSNDTNASRQEIYRAWFAPTDGKSIGDRLALARGFDILAAHGSLILAQNFTTGEVVVIDSSGAIRVLVPDPVVQSASFSADGSGVFLQIQGAPPTFYPLSGGAPIPWPNGAVLAQASFASAAAFATSVIVPSPITSVPVVAGPGPSPTGPVAGTTSFLGPPTVAGTIALPIPTSGGASNVVVRDSSGAVIPVTRSGNQLSWDTTAVEDGYYTIDTTDSAGNVVQTQTVLVQNPHTTPRRFEEAAAIGVVASVGVALLISSFEATAKQWALSRGESKFAKHVGSRASVGGIGLVAPLAAALMLALTSTYSSALSPLINWAQFLELLPIIGLAIIAAFAADFFFDSVFARLEGRETEYRLHIPGIVALAVSTFVFGTPFGAPGSTEGAHLEDKRLAGHRGLFSFLHLLTLLLPFALLAGWRFIVFESGSITVVMLAVNIALPLGELPGKAVWDWNKWAWLGVFTLMVLLFVQSVFGASPILFGVIGLAAAAGLLARFIRIEELRPRSPRAIPAGAGAGEGGATREPYRPGPAAPTHEADPTAPEQGKASASSDAAASNPESAAKGGSHEAHEER
ncbi:MAG: hypothetical protein ACYDDF_11170 [Thermoplasmatota archaeon]